MLKLVEIQNDDTKAISPILASYKLVVLDGTVEKKYWAEVRDGPNGVSIDWSDDLQDELIRRGVSEEIWNELGKKIFNYFSDNSSDNQLILVSGA